MSAIDTVKILEMLAQKSNGLITAFDLLDSLGGGDAGLKGLDIDVFVDGVKQEEVCAFNVVKGSSITHKKDDDGKHVILRSHIDAILDTVETVGHLQVYVGGELVAEVKG